MLTRLKALAAVALPLMLSSGYSQAASSAGPRIGVYYFPGWDGPGSGWTKIEPYGDREPALGWYDDKSPNVMRQQVAWMAGAGIDYVVFDWYWQNNAVHADGAVEAYKALPQTRVRYSILWANDQPGMSLAQWREMVAVWLDRYLKTPNYLRADGKPVVFVLSFVGLQNAAKESGSDVAIYVQTAQRMAQQAGLRGIYFVGGFDDLSTTLITYDAVKAGFNAVSAYNLHREPWAPRAPGWDRLTRGYPALDRAYRSNWHEAMRSSLPVVVPMTSGWDKRPWDGSSDPLHDRSIASPTQFRAHLAAAKAMMAMPGKQQSGLGVVCCWNEYGEGSFIEPTRRDRSAQLDQIKVIFGTDTR